MNVATLSHQHVFEPGNGPNAPTLLLLHGTGADEHDLIPLGRLVAPGANLLSPRGQVKEGPANRWFRRHAEGVFDEADIVARADALAAFVSAAMTFHALPGPPVAVGFSNGANMAAGLLWRQPDVLSGAALLRATLPLKDQLRAPQHGKPVLILSGASDPFAPEEQRDRLASRLAQAGVIVTHRVTAPGHGLGQTDVAACREWFNNLP